MIQFLLRLLARLPLCVLHALGRWCGLIVYMLPGRYRSRLQANAAQAGYTDPAFMRRAAAQTGAMIMETPKIWLQEEACMEIASFADPEIIDKLIAEGRGLIFLTPHLGSFEICARKVARHMPLTVMFREPRQAALRPVVEQARNNSCMRAVPANTQGVREFVRTLRRGEAVGMLPDQVPGRGEGVWAPVFGREAYTVTLPGRLATQTGAAVFMVAGERLPRGRGWRIHFVRVPEPLPQEAEAQAALFNAAMALLIERFPEQYLWSYNRYKVTAHSRDTTRRTRADRETGPVQHNQAEPSPEEPPATDPAASPAERGQP